MLPDFKGRSLVNLMASIGRWGGWRSPYQELDLLPSSKLDSERVILVVVDGLGLDYLERHGRGEMREGLRGSITSLFPSGTASCVSTFQTGLAPQQHAVTGWHINLKELGVVAAILPFHSRSGKSPFSEAGVSPSQIVDADPFAQKIDASSSVVTPAKIKDSDFNLFASGSSKIYGCSTPTGFFRQAKRAVEGRGRRFVYAYWPEFDHLFHENGSGSRKLKRHLREFSRGFDSFLERLEGTDTTVILTADHGLYDLPPRKSLLLEDHPEMERCLSLPLCGGWRVLYAYVRNSSARDFKRYVGNKLSHAFEARKSSELVKENFFGLFEPSEKLLSRIGDFTLIAKGDFTLHDRLMAEKRKSYRGMHGGTSEKEMQVPLVVARP